MQEPQSQLTQREQEIMLLVVSGKLNKEIEQELGIARRTVETHLTNIYTKLSVSNRTEAALRFSHNQQLSIS